MTYTGEQAAVLCLQPSIRWTLHHITHVLCVHNRNTEQQWPANQRGPEEEEKTAVQDSSTTLMQHVSSQVLCSTNVAAMCTEAMPHVCSALPRSLLESYWNT